MSRNRTHLVQWLCLCLFWATHATTTTPTTTTALEQDEIIDPFSFSSTRTTTTTTTSLLRGPAVDASSREISDDEESSRRVLLDEHSSRQQAQKQTQHRSLQQQEQAQQYQCNQVVATVTDARQHLSQLLKAHGYQDSMERERAAFALLPLLKFGVRIYKICASCEDVSSWWETTTTSLRSTICSSGSQTMQSGLLFVPTTMVVAPDNPSAEEAALRASSIQQFPLLAKSLLPGTHKGVVVVPSQSSSVTLGDLYPIVPSKTQNMGDASSLVVVEGWQIQAFVAASAGNVALMPDFRLDGETSSKAFLVKKSYQTGFLPLWFQSKELLASETDCHTALSDTALVMGYGDGGYGALAIANILHKGLGVKILSTQAGAIPARLGSSMIPKLIQSLDENRFPKERNYLLALLGAAYSSSTQDQTQTLLSPQPQVRSNYMALVETSNGTTINDSIDKTMHSLHVDDTNIMEETIKRAPTSDSPLEIWDALFVLAMRNGIETNNFDPCHTPSSLATFDFERLCATLEDNDLTVDELEGVQYPVRICHSVDDEVVDISNLPNFSANKEYLSYTQIKGKNHVEAARECMMESLLILRNLGDADDSSSSQTKTADLHRSSCPDVESLDGKTDGVDDNDNSASKKTQQLVGIGGIFLFIVFPIVALGSTILFFVCKSKRE